ncbi:acetate/propionate family kinase [Microvirga sp. HBU67558]|uniref:acetate/propionate family kinase n=1 Tax=Microvirga TaxID=186650 RepID=UPI001B3759EB|nr:MULTISPECIES: acetate/propionate family kinase [unclassified Microvirga]MBQ0821746.1 acetate/propionate family kinase [Microvirga sp. HBU67558]
MIPVLIVLNAGSSSLKFQVFDMVDDAEPQLVWKGLYEGLGGSAHFVVKDNDGAALDEMTWSSGDRIGHEEALMHLVSWLRSHQEGRKLAAIGHRVVHGGQSFSAPVMVDDSVVEALEALVPLAPLHQPHNLEPIRIVRRRLSGLPQIACFDTAFHQTQSDIASLFALPREMRDLGVRRYGFHGLSYEYIASTLRDYDPRLADGKVIVAHLGNGASLCALKGGVSVATTMGFSALDGLPMGTRCGAIDAGVVFFMLREMKLSPAEAERMLYTKSGLLGVSGISNDMRVLRSKAAGDPDARRAIDLFVYRITREIGSLVAALGGIDGLVFTAGIGENDVATRAEVISGLSWAGFSLHEAANSAGGPQITFGTGPTAWVIPTNEELVIARQTGRVLDATRERLAS